MRWSLSVTRLEPALSHQMYRENHWSSGVYKSRPEGLYSL